MLDLSISIVSYNTRDLLRQCLNSIKEGTHGLSYEIIVVDNNSPDCSADMVENEFPEVILIRNQENLFFAGAHTQALQAARGEYICLLNPDMIILRDTFRVLVNKMKSNERIGAIGCKLLSEDNRIQETLFRSGTAANFLSLSRYLGALLKPFISDRRYPLEAYEQEGFVEIMQNSLMILRRDFMLKKRLFDPQLKLYCTEDQITEELKSEGLQVYYTPEVTSIHFLGRSTRPDKNPTFIYRINRWDNYIFYKKYHGFLFGAMVYLLLSADLGLIRLAYAIKRLIRYNEKSA